MFPPFPIYENTLDCTNKRQQFISQHPEVNNLSGIVAAGKVYIGLRQLAATSNLLLFVAFPSIVGFLQCPRYMRITAQYPPQKLLWGKEELTTVHTNAHTIEGSGMVRVVVVPGP